MALHRDPKDTTPAEQRRFAVWGAIGLTGLWVLLAYPIVGTVGWGFWLQVVLVGWGAMAFGYYLQLKKLRAQQGESPAKQSDRGGEQG